LKKFKKTLEDGKTGLSKTNTMKVAILPKAIHRFNTIPIKVPMIFFAEIEKTNPEIYMEAQKIRIAKASMNKKSNAGGVTIPDFKLYYRIIVTKAAWYWHKTDM
jgi:hypothetical protein